MQRTTIKDIAKKLGISPSTVSRALKDHPDISEKTKKLVADLAKELKYHPNTMALNLRNNKSNIIGVVIPQIVHHFFSSVISGIEDFAHSKGYTVIVSQSNETYKREIDNINALVRSGVEGFIISRTKETTNFDHFEKILSFDIPIVFFDRICPTIKTDKVIVNDEYSAYMAVEHLIINGCKKIVHFKGPDNLEISKKRLTGYLEALREYKIHINKSLIMKADTFDEGKKITQDLLDNKIQFDGIFAVNDDSAAGAIITLNENNIRIPYDVSIFGFSNNLISEIIKPKLSSVAQPGYEMGFTATKLLIERIESTKEIRPRTEVISTKLILRESTINHKIIT